MNKLLIIIALFFTVSCSNKTNTVSKTSNKTQIKDNDTGTINTQTHYENRISIELSELEVMLAEDIKFNGKLKRYLTVNEFEKVFGKADSTKLMKEDEPCSYIFENKDGSKDLDDKYLYKNGSRFENSKEKVAVEEFRFINNNFILYKGQKFDSFTTISDVKKIFPKAFEDINEMDVDGKQFIQLREDENNISDGHIRIFFKNKTLYSICWYFPC